MLFYIVQKCFLSLLSYQSVQATTGNVRTNLHMYYQVPRQESQTVTLSVPTLQKGQKVQKADGEAAATDKGMDS